MATLTLTATKETSVPQPRELSDEERIENIIRSSRNLTIGSNQAVPPGPDPEGLKILPEVTKKRLENAGIDLSKGYPARPDLSKIPVYVDDAYKIRNEDYPFVDRGKFADPEKKALFGAAKEIRHLTKHLGTEIVGLQLADLNDKQKDELALLIAERVVVFFRDQELSPQKQLELGHYWGQVEVHAQTSQVPGLPGVTVIWGDYQKQSGFPLSFKHAKIGTNQWHTDLVHEHQPAGITHLHNDAIPEVGGDTCWLSGYAAYDKLSPALQEFLDGKEAVYYSAHSYLDRSNPFSGPKRIERTHPIVRTHPVTGWKSLFVNRQMTSRIVGLEAGESDLILNYLYKVFEDNLDIQVRFNWKPSKPGLGTSALWDNRVSQHSSVYDHLGEEPRHGTRVTSLLEVPFFDKDSKSQRTALGLSLD